MMEEAAATFEDIIASREDQISERLRETRRRYRQSGDIGSHVEELVRNFLNEFLPRHYSVSQGEVIDSGGNRSKQTDVVIVNEYHPRTFTEDSPGLFFIEGVSAAGEVKTHMTGRDLLQAIDNSIQFKKLRMKLPPKHTVLRAKPSDLRRYYLNPPYFIWAFDSQLGMQRIQEKLKSFMSVERIGLNETNRMVDAIFIKNRGSLINYGDGQGSLMYREKGEWVRGWLRRDISEETSSVLYDFLVWLLLAIPSFTCYFPIFSRYLNVKHVSDYAERLWIDRIRKENKIP